MNVAIEFRSVDILFPPHDRRDGRKALRDALALLDAGRTRAEIAEKLAVIVGVAGASLAVDRGEISVLMGLSGSGKSTLLRAANGLNRVARGSVLVHEPDGAIDVANCDATALRRLRRERIAMVFQQFGLLPWRTVRDNVGFGLELRGESVAARRRVVDEKLELVGLTQWADRHVAELSGGMQQRVGLARAFATDADILLMDEPFSALDPLIRGKLQDELLALQARVKKTILFVSHDMDEALRLGDRITILEGGRIVQTGTTEDIVLAPANEYVAEFVRHMNPLDVLTGAMIMRERGALPTGDGALRLDPAGRYALAVDADGRPGEARADGHPLALVPVPADGALPAAIAGLAIAPASLSLHEIIALRQRSGHPVVLTEGGCVVGVCGEEEILSALAGARARAAA
ncbi:MAG: choline ABC transporter ATP-binding protein [Gammaproteobacteria bacterium]|nr:choline ABC transporter ATP-binding protein [Gammaproteobacteria bacterium]